MTTIYFKDEESWQSVHMSALDSLYQAKDSGDEKLIAEEAEYLDFIEACPHLDGGTSSDREFDLARWERDASFVEIGDATRKQLDRAIETRNGLALSRVSDPSELLA